MVQFPTHESRSAESRSAAFNKGVDHVKVDFTTPGYQKPEDTQRVWQPRVPGGVPKEQQRRYDWVRG